MSKATTKPKAPAVTKTALVDPRSSGAAGQDTTLPEDAPVAPRPRRTVIEDYVTAMVVKPFKLTGDDQITRNIEVGEQKMSRADAEHWFSVAQGVTIKDE